MASNAHIRTRSYTIQMRTYSIRWAWADAVVQSAKYGNIDIFIIHFFTQMLCISNHTHTTRMQAHSTDVLPEPETLETKKSMHRHPQADTKVGWLVF